MSGEPAMTLIPNFLFTGLLAILFSFLFLFLVFKPAFKNRHILLLLAILLLMLLCGAGFGPPLVGILASLIALKRNSSFKVWRKMPEKVHRVLARLWPWSYGLCLTAWLLLFPGTGLISTFAGIEDELLMILPILLAFAFIPITLLLGFSVDLLHRPSD
jgi:hypothetical protein